MTLADTQIARTALVRRAWALSAAAVIAVSLVSCAPEPGTSPSEIAGTTSKEELANGTGGTGGSWSEENPDGVSEKTPALPDSFPSEAFVIPEGTVIDDAGERSGTGWFVVFRTEDLESGAELWTQVITGSGFEAVDVTTGEGDETFATLAHATLTVDALMIPQEDHTVLLSYDLSPVN